MHEKLNKEEGRLEGAQPRVLMLYVAKKIHIRIHNAPGILDVLQLGLHNKAVSSKDAHIHSPKF